MGNMIVFRIIMMLYARVVIWGPTLHNADVHMVFKAIRGYGGERMDGETWRSPGE